MVNEHVPCPWCGTAAHVRRRPNTHAVYCRRCKREFEDVDDGTIGYGPPDRRMRREEARTDGRREMGRMLGRLPITTRRTRG